MDSGVFLLSHIDVALGLRKSECHRSSSAVRSAATWMLEKRSMGDLSNTAC